MAAAAATTTVASAADNAEVVTQVAVDAVGAQVSPVVARESVSRGKAETKAGMLPLRCFSLALGLDTSSSENREITGPATDLTAHE